MAATDPQPLPEGMTAAPILLPVDFYAQLCVKAHRTEMEPADYLGWLMVAAIEAADVAGVGCGGIPPRPPSCWPYWPRRSCRADQAAGPARHQPAQRAGGGGRAYGTS